MAKFGLGFSRRNKYRVVFRTRALVGEVGTAIDRAMKDVAPEMASDIATQAPIKTGRLRRSIAVRAIRGYGRKDSRLEVMTVYYGRFVDLGTIHMSPRPFVWSVMIGRRRYWRRKILRRSKRYLKRRR